MSSDFASCHVKTLRNTSVFMRVDGVDIVPFSYAADAAIFLLPPGTQEVRLISSTWSPHEVDVQNPDNRQLGVRIDSLAVGGLIGVPAVVALNGPEFLDGFHVAESWGGTWFLWTNGDARIPSQVWAHVDGAVVLHLRGFFGDVENNGDSGDNGSLTHRQPNSNIFAQPGFIPSQTVPFFLAVGAGLLAPIALTHSEAAFLVPAGTREVALMSPVWSPKNLDPSNSDNRKLGLLIEGLSVDDLLEPAVPIALDDPCLSGGFHTLENGTEGVYRWTDGNGRIEDARWQHRQSAFVLRIRGQLNNAATSPDERELVLRFENLGADCELGIVQRLSTAEPLGLLRWADVPFRSLMEALEARFEGLGDPEFTNVAVGEGDEYFTRDSRWGLPMHTFVKRKDASIADIFLKMSRHITFLRDKMLSDLACATKIFVYKHDELTMWELRALHDCLSRFGPVSLLHVKRASSKSFPFIQRGKVNIIHKGLYVVFLESTAIDSLYNRIQDWKRVCRMTIRHVDAESAAEKTMLKLVVSESGRPVPSVPNAAPANQTQSLTL